MSNEAFNNAFVPSEKAFEVTNIDALLTREECAAWMQTSQRQLAENPKIPAFKPSHRVVRYHPRTILAKLAFDAGVPLAVIAASYGEPAKPRK